MSDVQDRINSSTRRINTLLGDIEVREAAQRRAERAERMMAEREQARADSERRREYQTRYDQAFEAFGTRAPAPVEGERPGQYRRRMFELLRNKLPSDHEWADVRADDIPASARAQIEAMVIKAAMREGLQPSPENLPANGELVRRDLVDQMSGQRSIGWHGKESFIKSLGRESARVVRFIDPRTQNVIMGLPFSRRG